MVKKLVFLIVINLFLIHGAVAAERIAGASATMSSSMKKEAINTEAGANTIKDYAVKKRTIMRVLSERNSPLASSADAFMRACIRYNIDCYLLPSITGLESSFGQAILPGSYNPFGWGGGYIIFKNWDESINTVAAGLRRSYVSDGPITPDLIGRRYSESGTWAVRVSGFMARFNAEEEKELHSRDFALE